MNIRYGKRQLEMMASVLASEDYVRSNARPCPHCHAPIEKNDGCNKVGNGDNVQNAFFDPIHNYLKKI